MPVAADPLVGTREQRIEHAGHAAAGATIGPAAMSALLDAQENMGGDASLLGRARTVRQIDKIITRLTDSAVTAVTTPGADFSLTRLMTARQQLRTILA